MSRSRSPDVSAASESEASSGGDLAGGGAARRAGEPLFDLSGIDLSGCARPRADIEDWLPHRGPMLQLERVVWEHPTRLRGVGFKHVRDDEFWVAGAP